ncbi:MAG: ribonuclease P protein component [Porticoccaceae bacterium]|nr:ribonuclease P protein component [Porticoccaceae bacterium]MEA3300541.1 ribonuclease P protein component [Pseudomonadota bacterium]HLS97977.1 ribonuclease P protein component [Porticoccaceae bacterium]
MAARFDKTRRLLNAAQFQAVFDRADFKVGHPQFLVLARRSTLGHARLGLVIGKKNIRRAVARNRVKRVVRDTFRHRADRLDSLDIIFLARKGFDTLLPGEQTSIMRDTWERLARKVDKA